MIRCWKIRLYPSVSQVRTIDRTLRTCCELYNACIQERRDAWRVSRKKISQYDQQNQLPGIKLIRHDLKEFEAQVLQNVCARVNFAFQSFFRRVSVGDTPGYPRFRSIHRYDSFTYPQAYERNKFRTDRIFLPKIGWVKWKTWIPILEMGRAKTVTIKQQADGWYAFVACEIDRPAALPRSGSVIGIDLGLSNFVTTDSGTVLGSLSDAKRSERDIRRLQSIVSRRRVGSNRRRKAIRVLAKRCQRLARSTKAKLDIISRGIVSSNDILCIEDLNINGLLTTGFSDGVARQQRKGIRRNIRLAGWGILRRMLTYKAESAGRKLIAVPPAGTSQECSSCAKIVKKSLRERIHRCSCGLVLDRDVNAAKNILKRGLRLLQGEDALAKAPCRSEHAGALLATDVVDRCVS